MPDQTLSDDAPDAAGHAPSAAALIEHIQCAAENHKALLARELHDELGGLLVGAVMDVAWAEQHVSAPPAELKQKLVRARQTLAAAIDMKRKLIENLRPTLLDNVGLYAALRWHVQAICNAAAILHRISLPDEERRFLPNVPIVLFRIVQEVYAVVASQGQATSTDFSVTAADGSLTIRIASTMNPRAQASNGSEPPALSAIRYRTTTLGGAFSYDTMPAVGPIITATFPLESIVAGM